jgi:integrase/recombinase XerD
MTVMSTYLAKRSSDEAGEYFGVYDGDGRVMPLCDEFLLQLRLRDCSVYTQRSYALGLAHFFTWLEAEAVEPERVTRQIVGRYVAVFGESKPGGAVSTRAAPKTRSARTVNHRLSVLASFFDFHIRRDTEDGAGPWRGRTNLRRASYSTVSCATA